MTPEQDIRAWLVRKLRPHEDPTHSFAPRILDALAAAIAGDLPGLVVVATQVDEAGVTTKIRDIIADYRARRAQD